AVGGAWRRPPFPTRTGEWLGPGLAVAPAVYSNGLLVGETLPASFTGPRVAPALGGSWPLTFAAWSIPAFLAAGLVIAIGRQVAGEPGAPSRRGWPDFPNRQRGGIRAGMGFATAG